MNPAPYKKFVLRGFIEMESDVCFLPMITPQSNFLLRLYRHYKNGWLPDSGGLLDQPAMYLQAMELIGQVIDSNEERNARGANREQGNHYRGRPQ